MLHWKPGKIYGQILVRIFTGSRRLLIYEWKESIDEQWHIQSGLLVYLWLGPQTQNKRTHLWENWTAITEAASFWPFLVVIVTLSVPSSAYKWDVWGPSHIKRAETAVLRVFHQNSCVGSFAHVSLILYTDGMWNSGPEEVWWSVLVVILPQFRITGQECFNGQVPRSDWLWACLWGIFFIVLIEMGRLTPNVCWTTL